MAIIDNFGVYNNDILAPARHAAAVTPHDTNELGYLPRMLYVGGAGDLRVTMANDADVTFTAVPAGTQLPLRVRRVFSTGTTATSVVALW